MPAPVRARGATEGCAPSRCVHPWPFSRVQRPLISSRRIPNAMSKTDPWVVHKFGGSSVADADCFRRVAAIIEASPASRVAVVLSACRGVTDALLRLVALAERQDVSFRGEIAELRARHGAIAAELLEPASAWSYLEDFDRDCRDLQAVLHAVTLTKAAARNVTDLVAGYGELWSTQLFERFLAERGRR